VPAKVDARAATANGRCSRLVRRAQDLQPRAHFNFSDPASLPAPIRAANEQQLAASGFKPSSSSQVVRPRPAVVRARLRARACTAAACSACRSPPPSCAWQADGRAACGAQGSTQAGPLRTATLQSAGGSDPAAQGSDLSVLQGVRIATPFFGTGYNFCIGA
jgi:hypothetical protein